MNTENVKNAHSAGAPQGSTGVFGSGPSGRLYACDGPAAAVLDNRGAVLRWTKTAEDLTGFRAEEVCGRPAQELVADLPDDLRDATEMPASGRVRLWHQCGDTVDVTFRTTKVGSTEFLVLAAPTHHVADHEQGAALLRALSAQDRITIAVHDTDLSTVQTNATPGPLDGCPVQPGARLSDVLCAKDAENLEAVLRQVLETGAPVIRRNQQVSWRHDPARQQALSLSAFRLEDARGRPTGVAALYMDNADQMRARRNLDLAREVAEQVGGSLDVVRTAQDLADVLAPAFGDLAAVDLAHSVFGGEEPSQRLGGAAMGNAALAPVTAGWPAGIKHGDPVPPLPDHPLLRSFRHGETVVFGLDDFIAMVSDPQLVEYLVPKDAHSVMVAPLHARGLTLGAITAWRCGRSDPFTEDEADLMRQIASRGALAIDNARRYTREHRAAIALQQRLLPPATTDTPAAETTGVYLPAGNGAEIRGDWYDAIALPSLRVALVAGDVIGHGMLATATMGRLRAAIQTLADLELEPDEVLARIADLVQRLVAEAPPDHHDVIGATCLYAVYDPVTQRCAIASAGHLPPVVVRPDGTAEVVAISPGPPLAIGGLPYETTVIDLEPGSVLALCTNGLIEQRDRDIDQGLRCLTDALAASCRPERALDETGRALLANLTDHAPRDDAALLLARTRAITAEDTAHWEIPADPAAVCKARAWATRQLTTWGLEDLLFSTELIVSELVTNAIRYGRQPAELRLIRHDVLVCEVTDSSGTQPRLRRAATTDEGGRGLFLVAQLGQRWGCRHGQNRKTIWSEQLIECPR
ncbi:MULTISPECIES: SpoIIE family protein phosphatase [unclassified Streptomyces]|uniref:SpoIIE family protein phosphatase n=1 Tax=unclassified Streptomyces TaxID=2593676 RepID=UPI002DDA1698|nr:SpoIIE family protein phosphatase [Streptomyces sp. NBC_01751]WSD29258.1 SpoIIE family protein phosphatase [Streptomyces sp. NBC_01751]WSF82413.1 SpoIIE family protein phosphatase [Streptomyces sp. NBC_01744]